MDDYLALRQQLKQSIRAAQLQRDSGSATNLIGGGHAHNNYGCFFGRSETVFAGKAAKEISNLWLKLKVDSTDSKKDSAASMRKKKVQRFKETRDYSFLSSSFEGEICSSTAPPPPIKRDAKRGLITKDEKPTKLTVKEGFKRGAMTKNPRKLMEKGGKRDAADKKSCNSSRAKKESKQESKKISASKQSEQKKKEGEKREREEGNCAIDIIRELFGYDPTTFSDDEEEELKMEASFADIQKEERRSAKIASKEDRRELRKLEAERGKKRKLMN